MHDDKVSQVIKGDELILRFVGLLGQKHGQLYHQYIRQWARELGHLMLHLHQMTGDFTLTISKLLLTENFDLLVDTT